MVLDSLYSTTRKFKTVIILLDDADGPAVIDDAGILQTEIADSCRITCATMGPRQTRIRFYFCPCSLFRRLCDSPDLDDWEKENRLYKLIGSEKQIEWARVIRSKQLPEIQRAAEELKEQEPSLGRAIDMVLESLRKLNSAPQWINNRDNDPTNMLLFGLERAKKLQEKLRELADS